MLRPTVQLLSWFALIGTLLPSILFFFGWIDLDRAKWGMLLATLVWFIATPLWMGRQGDEGAAAQE